MANQQNILPMGRLQGVTVDIVGACTQIEFEVIEIVDDSNPYPTLLGIDWATYMNGIINLKKRKIIFEKNSLRVVIPLDPSEGKRYTEPVRDNDYDGELDCIYQLTARDRDRVNPIADDRLSWDHDSSCTSDSDEEVERWQNRLHEVTILNYNRMVVIGAIEPFAEKAEESIALVKSKLGTLVISTIASRMTLVSAKGEIVTK